MKRNISLLFMSATMVLCFSCNNPNSTGSSSLDTINQKSNSDEITASQQKKATTPGKAAIQDLCEEEGSYNLSITKSEADPMIEAFEQNFRKGNNRITPSVWISACVILSLADTLKANADTYDGVRIYNGADKRSRNQTTILLIPTFKSLNHSPDFTKPYAQGCDGGEYKGHKLSEDEKINYEQQFNLIYRGVRRREHYRPATNDTFSMGMWTDECVIQSLAKLIRDEGYDGVRICSAAYFTPDNTPTRARGRFADTQSTFILVTTRSNGSGGHVNDWELKNKFVGGSYNHGDLCPEVCE